MTTSRAALEAFATEARRYCAWALAPDRDRRPAEALAELATIYRAALSLPTTYVEFDDPPKWDVQGEEARVREAFSALPLRYYSEQFDPLNVPATEEATIGDVINDITEVFRDVRRGLWLFDQGHFEAARWEWNFGFQSHWGRHAVCAMRALHAYVTSNGES